MGKKNKKTRWCEWVAWVLWALCLELVMCLVAGWLLAAQLAFSSNPRLYIPTLKRDPCPDISDEFGFPLPTELDILCTHGVTGASAMGTLAQSFLNTLSFLLSFLLLASPES